MVKTLVGLIFVCIFIHTHTYKHIAIYKDTTCIHPQHKYVLIAFALSHLKNDPFPDIIKRKYK